MVFKQYIPLIRKIENYIALKNKRLLKYHQKWNNVSIRDNDNNYNNIVDQ